MPTQLDQLPGGVTGLARKVAAVERAIRELRAARRLGTSAFEGALRVVDANGNTVAEIVSDLAGRAGLVAYDTRSGQEYYAALTAGDARFGVVGETDPAGEAGLLFADLGTGQYELVLRSGQTGGTTGAQISARSETAPAAGDSEIILTAARVRVTGTLQIDGQPAAVTSIQTASFSATSTTYTTASTAGPYADCAVVFVAPPSGRVKVHTAARMVNTGATVGTLVSPEVRDGATIGAGTVIEGAGDGTGVSHYGTTFARSGADHLMTGLTPGTSYNARLLHRSTSGTETASIALRELIIEPA